MGAAVQCSIHRDKSSKMYPKYQLVLESGTRFLMSARKRKKSKTHNYILSFDQDDTSRQSPNFAGKMRANFLGTGFVIYDKGLKPSKAGESDVAGLQAVESASDVNMAAVRGVPCALAKLHVHSVMHIAGCVAS